MTVSPPSNRFRGVVVGSVLASGAVGVACGLFVDQQSFVLTTDAAGGVPPVRDAGLDTSVHDAHVTRDAERDAGASLDAGHDAGEDTGHLAVDAGSHDALVDVTPKAFCATQDATFCVDFDEGSLADAGFTAVSHGAGITTQLDPTVAFSRPNSVELALAANDSGTCNYAEVTRTFSDHSPMSSAELTFEVMPDYLDGDAGRPIVAALTLTGCSAFVALGQSSVALEVQRSNPEAGFTDTYTTSMEFATQLSAGAWTTVELDVTLDTDAGAGSASISVAGHPYLLPVTLPAICKGPAIMTLLVGPYCINHTAVKMHADNVVFRGK